VIVSNNIPGFAIGIASIDLAIREDNRAGDVIVESRTIVGARRQKRRAVGELMEKESRRRQEL